MEDFSTYLGISWTFSLICCMIWIFSPAEGKTISQAVGSRVILHCVNESISTLSQLTWKMNDALLFSLSFTRGTNRHNGEEARNLNIEMSESKSHLYALIIERARTAHTGNYTCETTNTDVGAGKVTWELIITEHTEHERWEKIVIAVAVPCVCLLILIISLAILRKVCKRRAENSMAVEMVNRREQTEDIYENCLENNFSHQRGYTQPHHFKTRAH